MHKSRAVDLICYLLYLMPKHIRQEFLTYYYTALLGSY